jgi:FOG: WD40-like repeat
MRPAPQARAAQAAAQTGRYSYDLPLDPESPWPKFRANSLENGRSPVMPRNAPGLRPWAFETGKGVFSSPVVDGEGTVYVGSANHVFYAIREDGSLKWKLETGEIIDSSALLDDRGRVYFGSGDGRLYCLDRATGEVEWTYRAQSAAEVEKEFKYKISNVNWFEGNVGILPDGSLLAPNDNYIVYAVDRDTGARKGQYLGNQMVWSLPAINVSTGRLFFGTDNSALKTIYCYDARDGSRKWTAGGLGPIAATPLLTSEKSDGALVLGAFDGYVRAYSQASGCQLWKFGTRDHIYASPAQLSDGTIIQPSADGTIYALSPEKGERKWAFDTLQPIRSSPAVDGEDRIYVGSGDGRLLCLEPDGRLRWSYRCIELERDDLNASPALGPHGVYVAGETGGIFFVPYDYALSEIGAADPRAATAQKDELPAEGAFLMYTTKFGGLARRPPAVIAANEPLTFSLFVRSRGNTALSAIDRDSVKAVVSGDPSFKLAVSANRAFFTLIPQETWTGLAGGRLSVRVSGTYSVGLSRFGLKFFCGRRGGSFDASYDIEVPSRVASPMPYRAPDNPGEDQSTFEFYRLSVPEPSMMPSWNQIGFDSLHYISGIVERRGDRALLWAVGGKPQEGAASEAGSTAPAVIDPGLGTRYPLYLDYSGGLVTFSNYEKFKINFVGTWDMPFGFYRIATTVDPATGELGAAGSGDASLSAVALCDEIESYGFGLKLMGLSEFDTGKLTASGGLQVRPWNGGRYAIPSGVSCQFEVGPRLATARIAASGPRLDLKGHVYSLLLVDEEAWRALPLYYTKRTAVEADPSGRVVAVSVAYEKGEAKGRLRAFLMVDCYPAAWADV